MRRLQSGQRRAPVERSALDAVALSPPDPTPQINARAHRGKLSRLRRRARRLSRLPPRYARSTYRRRAEFHRRSARNRSEGRQNPAEHGTRPKERRAVSADARAERRRHRDARRVTEKHLSNERSSTRRSKKSVGLLQLTEEAKIRRSHPISIVLDARQPNP